MRWAWQYLERNRHIHRAMVWLAQLGIFACSAIAAYLLRFDLSIPPQLLPGLAWALPIWLVLKSLVFQAANLHRGWWRYSSLSDLLRIAFASFTGSAAAFLVIVLFVPVRLPRSIYLIDLMLSFLFTAGVRVAVRVMAEAAGQSHSGTEKRTLIYGAGEAGIALLREIQKNPKLPYQVMGFVDDRGDKKGVQILGVSVLGHGEDLAEVAARQAIDVILVAIPSARGAQMARILKLCHAAGVLCKTVPGLSDVIEERGLAGQIRDVAVEDLLGRTPVRLEEGLIRGAIAGSVVMVTGAAGSIGSELCRQLARFGPAGIVGFEIAESPLFEIDREMRQSFPHIPFHPEIGSVQNRARLGEVMRQYRPAAVYHAAAYKHVPLMEAHVFEAVENNVFGTFNTAAAAEKYGVKDFVMISSDKAVRPTNIMGATKRVAELLLLAMQNGGVKYVAVRFGNVLGSNGSVIPIFKRQIAAGGPLTVTHPEMRRFFMTIPEACQLVLQAAAVGKGGQICVLDMGEPMKIVDLARDLILLSGLKPGEDIKIEFTGVRPGEKLYEELSSLLEDTVPTAYEKIRIFVGNGMPAGGMLEWLEALREICEARDAGRLVVALKEIVLDYSPSANLLKRVIKSQETPAAVRAAAGAQ
jgi:FlaA1/EpsC-like NDP-sugar epimerase